MIGTSSAWILALALVGAEPAAEEGPTRTLILIADESAEEIGSRIVAKMWRRAGWAVVERSSIPTDLASMLEQDLSKLPTARVATLAMATQADLVVSGTIARNKDTRLRAMVPASTELLCQTFRSGTTVEPFTMATLELVELVKKRWRGRSLIPGPVDVELLGVSKFSQARAFANLLQDTLGPSATVASLNYTKGRAMLRVSGGVLSSSIVEAVDGKQAAELWFSAKMAGPLAVVVTAQEHADGLPAPTGK